MKIPALTGSDFDEIQQVEISKLIEAMEVIFRQYGTGLSDAEYIQLPEWAVILTAAKNAANLIR